MLVFFLCNLQPSIIRLWDFRLEISILELRIKLVWSESRCYSRRINSQKLLCHWKDCKRMIEFQNLRSMASKSKFQCRFSLFTVVIEKLIAFLQLIGFFTQSFCKPSPPVYRWVLRMPLEIFWQELQLRAMLSRPIFMKIVISNKYVYSKLAAPHRINSIYSRWLISQNFTIE